MAMSTKNPGYPLGMTFIFAVLWLAQHTLPSGAHPMENNCGTWWQDIWSCGWRAPFGLDVDTDGMPSQDIDDDP